MPRKKSGNFNQSEYTKQFNKETYKRYQISVRKDDFDIIEKLESVQSKNAYILNLIRNDLKK